MARMKSFGGGSRKSNFKIGGSSDPMESIAKVMGVQMLKNQMTQQQNQAELQRMSDLGGVQTEYNVGGNKGFLPSGMKEQERIRGEAKAASGYAEESMKKATEGEILSGHLRRLKGLFDTVPRVNKGIGTRQVGIVRNMIQQAGQDRYGPQIDQFQDVKQAIAGTLVRVIGGESGARLSDFDIRRVLNAIPDIIGDTEDRGLIGWNNLFETIDEISAQHGGFKSMSDGSDIDLSSMSQEFMTPGQRGRARILSNPDLTRIDNQDLLASMDEYDPEDYEPEIRERLFSELTRRGMLNG